MNLILVHEYHRSERLSGESLKGPTIRLSAVQSKIAQYIGAAGQTIFATLDEKNHVSLLLLRDGEAFEKDAA